VRFDMLRVLGGAPQRKYHRRRKPFGATIPDTHKTGQPPTPIEEGPFHPVVVLGGGVDETPAGAPHVGPPGARQRAPRTAVVVCPGQAPGLHSLPSSFIIPCSIFDILPSTSPPLPGTTSFPPSGRSLQREACSPRPMTAGCHTRPMISLLQSRRPGTMVHPRAAAAKLFGRSPWKLRGRCRTRGPKATSREPPEAMTSLC
jgi:hypothetical protein